ncbi:hypothetical protein [Rhodoferax antarcticus]|uniref:hypothetical protein n=1 Tax=Rhodoferax antarcticus TaxID=81479 RepID=UPI0018E9760C|nr:hypothetical protein [Rhodoferax antarcticus]MCW2313849.1 putative nucleic acid-binding Zn ribbon protein [Rhodoferax antarcticus]
MADVQAGFSGWVIGMCFACDGTTHLTGKPVAIQYKGAGFFGNASGKSGLGLGSLKQVFAGFQISPIVVGQDEITLF